MNADNGPRVSDRVAVLLIDYQVARDDDRQHIATLFTVLSIGIAVAAALSAFATDSCAFDERQGCKRVPDAFFAAAPLVPFLTITLVSIYGAIATVRAFYIRALEDELGKYGTTLPLLAGLRAPSLLRYSNNLNSPGRGHWAVQAMYLVLLMGVIVIFLGMASIFATKVGPEYQLAMFIGYAALSALLLYVMNYCFIRGRVMARDIALADYKSMGTEPSEGARFFGLPMTVASQTEGTDRSLSSYLAIPRYKEAIKWSFVPAGMAILVVATGLRGGTWSQLLWNGLVTLVVVEYLIYQARYQLNDIRGFEADQAHPDRKGRGRLPGPVELFGRHAAWSAAVAASRLMIALILPGALSALGHTTVLSFPTVLLLIAIVFGTAVIYEYAREAEKATLVWLWVGIGYATRVAIGILVAGAVVGGGIPDGVLLLAVGGTYAMGVMFVLLTWALEAVTCSEAVVDRQGGVVLGEAGLGARPHVTRCLAYLPSPLPGPHPEPSDKPIASRVPALDPRGVRRSPWNLAALAACTMAGGLGAALIDRWDDAELLVMSALLGGLLAAVLVVQHGTSHRWVIVGCGGTVLAVLGAALTQPWGIVLSVPWLAVAATYVFFRSVSYHQLMNPPIGEARQFLDKAAVAGVRGAVGRRSFDLLVRTRGGDGTKRRDSKAT